MKEDTRHRVETELTNAEVEALGALTSALGVDPDAWTALGSPWVVFSTLAGLRIADRLREEDDALAPTEALKRASRRLGLAGSTLPKRIATWKRRAREEVAR